MKSRKILVLTALLILVSVLLSFTASANSTSTAQVEFEAGELTLTDVPAVDFGENKLSARTAIYPAKVIDSGITVVDARGNSAGWAVKVRLSNFMDGSRHVLPGSSMIITPPKVSSNTPVIPPSYSPETVEIVSGDVASQTIWAANREEGNGRWTMTLNPDQVSLKVNANRDALPSRSRADLYWTLVDAPAT